MRLMRNAIGERFETLKHTPQIGWREKSFNARASNS
jgi:hypothetical protein